MAEEHEHVLPFETYWLHTSRFPTLDLNLAPHMLAIYLVEHNRKKRTIDKLMRPFQCLVRIFSWTCGFFITAHANFDFQGQSLQFIKRVGECERQTGQSLVLAH